MIITNISKCSIRYLETCNKKCVKSFRFPEDIRNDDHAQQRKCPNSENTSILIGESMYDRGARGITY